MTTEQRPPGYLRADAARNLHRIVEVAARLLGDDPHAGMGAVATAADVSRATVYRHFPTREALLDAIRVQAVEHAERALVECRLDDGTATEALRRLVAAWLDVAQRYAFPQLAAQADPDGSGEARAHRRRVFGERLSALIERGQATGEFSSAISAEWGIRTFGALLLAGARAVDEDALPKAEAPDVVFRTLLEGLGG
jgi:TetR/AcrR family transcriptional repressor of mexCD-oprJ operon